jgi:hypothetical protein
VKEKNLSRHLVELEIALAGKHTCISRHSVARLAVFTYRCRLRGDSLIPFRCVSDCHAEWFRALNLENLEKNYQRPPKRRENELKLKLLIVGNLRSCEQDKEMLHVNAFLSEFQFGRTLQIMQL